MSENRPRKRWEILAKAIKSKAASSSEATKRKFQTYKLIETVQLECCPTYSWHRVKCRLLSDLRLEVRLLRSAVSVAELVGFNNTGNVCVWPAEECLAFYCLENRAQFTGLRVLELGGGMTCLAGLLLAATSLPKTVHLTDGNRNAVDNLEKVVDRNKDVSVSVGQLRWDDLQAVEEMEHSFDRVICADCLFFDSGRESLVAAIRRLLTKDGVAIIVAPSRGGTFAQFEKSASEVFKVEVKNNYNETIWEAHENYLEVPGYEEDIHYPRLMTLTNKPDSKF